MLTKYNIQERKLRQTEDEKAQIYLFTNPTLEEQRELVQHFEIDEHTLASALDPDELP